MLEDDAQDLGYYEYYGRKDHYYHGVHSPDHPSPLHLWLISLPAMAFGKLLGLLSVVKAMSEDEPVERPIFGEII